jgi:TRAP-type C4-dicarboxylate transport system permease small subunit
MQAYVRFVAILSHACGLIAGALIVASILVITQMVVLRYGFQWATIWQTEFVIYALIATTLIGSPYVMLRRGHVNMDILVLSAGQGTRLRLAIIADLIGIAFCGLIFVLGTLFWHEAWAKDWHSDTLWRIPLWIPYAALPLGMGVLTLQVIANLVSVVCRWSPPFGLEPTMPADLREPGP